MTPHDLNAWDLLACLQLITTDMPSPGDPNGVVKVASPSGWVDSDSEILAGILHTRLQLEARGSPSSCFLYRRTIKYYSACHETWHIDEARQGGGACKVSGQAEWYLGSNSSENKPPPWGDRRTNPGSGLKSTTWIICDQKNNVRTRFIFLSIQCGAWPSGPGGPSQALTHWGFACTLAKLTMLGHASSAQCTCSAVAGTREGPPWLSDLTESLSESENTPTTHRTRGTFMRHLPRI